MKSSINMAIARLGWFSFVASALLIVGLSLLSFTTLFLDTTLRVIVLVLTIAPALVFVCFHYLFEKVSGATAVKADIPWYSAATVIFLVWPGSILLLRYSLFSVESRVWLAAATWGWVLAFLGGIPLAKVFGLNVDMFRLVMHMRFIMYGYWQGEEVKVEQADRAFIKDRRKHTYVDKASIRAFQKTLTCAEVDCAAALEMFPEGWFNEHNGGASVLDIGGGEGLFTANLIRGMCGKVNVAEVKMVDPVEWSEDYTNTLATVASIDRSKVNVEMAGFEDMSVLSDADLVIASHSLYASIDSGFNAEGCVTKLLNCLRTDGIAVVVLASRRGRAYDFKAAALYAIYGIALIDVAGEDIRGAFGSVPNRLKYVDDVIDVTELLRDFDSGNVAGPLMWMQYFLRCPDLSRDNLAATVLLLRQHARPFRSLTEDEQRRYVKLSAGLTNESWVLEHKVMVWLAGTSVAKKTPG